MAVGATTPSARTTDTTRVIRRCSNDGGIVWPIEQGRSARGFGFRSCAGMAAGILPQCGGLRVGSMTCEACGRRPPPWTFGYHRDSMSDLKLIDSLNERFAIAGILEFETGSGGLIRAAVAGRAAEGHVYLHGAHVTHHRPAGQRPLLFLSERSQFATGKAIRGGVPVIFPWFGARAGHPEAPDHGFARTREWAVESVASARDGSVALTLALEADDATRSTWPHEFKIRCHVVFGERLEMTLEVENRSDHPFD